MQAPQFYKELSDALFRLSLLIHEQLPAPLSRDDIALRAKIGKAQTQAAKLMAQSFAKKKSGVRG